MELGERLVPGLLDAMRNGCHLAGWLLTAHVRARALELISDISPEILTTEDLGVDLWAMGWCRLRVWPGRGGDVLERVARAVVREVLAEAESLPPMSVAPPGSLGGGLDRGLELARRRGLLAADQQELLLAVDLAGHSCAELARRWGVDERRLRRRRRDALAVLARHPEVLVEDPWLAAG